MAGSAPNEVVVVEEVLVPWVWLQKHWALDAVNVNAVVPCALRAPCGTPLGPGETLHGQLRVPCAAKPAQESQPVLASCGVLEGQHQPQLCEPVFLLLSACPASTGGLSILVCGKLLASHALSHYF